jgi:HPt (histidine-containing phosphotransfer) domain-containing protein
MTQGCIDRAIFDELRAIVGANSMRELLAAFYADTPRQLATMRQALDDGDASTFERAAHTLKSTSATFGAATLSAHARELELMGKGRALDAARAKLEIVAGEAVEVEKALRELSG